MVVSDKQLVKHLQKEARLEAELRKPDPANEKHFKIRQMEREIEELRRQSDLAKSELDELRRKLQEEPPVLKPMESPSPVAKKYLSFSGTSSPNPARLDRLGRQTMR